MSIDVMPIRRSQETDAATESVNRSLCITSDPVVSAERNAGRNSLYEKRVKGEIDSV